MNTSAKIRLASAIAALLTFSYAFSADLQSGVFSLRSVPGAQLDFRKIYLVKRDGKVEGFFDNPFTQPTENNPDANPTCKFFLNGEFYTPGEIQLHAWYPESDQAGDASAGASIFLTKSGDSWKVRIAGDLPNCDMPTVETGDFIKSDMVEPWQSIAYISKPKSYFYTRPHDTDRTRGYLVHSDAVAVIKYEGDWALVNYLRGDINLIRWMKRADLTER